MRTFRNISAYLLFLLFLRVMVPDKVIVALHAHTHTEESHDEHRVHIGKQHTHCPTDTLFDTPFQPPAEVRLAPQWLSCITSYQVSKPYLWKFCFPHNISLRGPPARTRFSV